MRKHVVTVLTLIFVVVLLVGATTAFAAGSPNFATNDHEDMSIYYYGYVQCQPSYIEDGNHAARGYIRYQRFDHLGNINKDTGRLYTAYGTGPNDSRILSRNYTFTVSVKSSHGLHMAYRSETISQTAGFLPKTLKEKISMQGDGQKWNKVCKHCPSKNG